MLKRFQNASDPMPDGVTLPKSATMRNSWIDVEDGATVVIGEGTKLDEACITVRCGAELSIGNLCEIRGRFDMGEDSRLAIGDGLICNGDVHIQVAEGGGIEIGRDCLFANPSIKNSDMHAIFDVASRERVNPPSDVVIGDRVWIATDALILKGVRLSPDSVVGAGAVVSGRFPAQVVLAGNPARVVREGVVWKRSLIDRLSITFGNEFSPSSFRAAAVVFDHDAVIRMGLPYLEQWPKMDRTNCSIFYYLARAILLKHFHSAPADEVTIEGVSVSLENVFQMLDAAYESSQKANYVCGAYVYLVASMLAKADVASRVYGEVRVAWRDIEGERFKVPWVREQAPQAE
jgi:acetyltransferase-like isoleucine patch superfamily enzyme